MVNSVFHLQLGPYVFLKEGLKRKQRELFGKDWLLIYLYNALTQARFFEGHWGSSIEKLIDLYTSETVTSNG